MIRLEDPEEDAILNSVHHVTFRPGADGPGPEYRLATIAGVLKREVIDDIYDKFCKDRVKTYDIVQDDGSRWHLYVKT